MVVGRATKARCWFWNGWEGDDDEGEEEPHPTTVASPIAIKIRDVRLLGIIEPLRGKWKFRQIEIWTNLRNMVSEVSRSRCNIINSKLGTPANMAVMENQTS